MKLGAAQRRTAQRRTAPLSRRREAAGFALGAMLLTGLTVLFSANVETVHVSTALSVYLLAVVVVAAVGGLKPAVVAALAAPVMANWYLVPPLHQWNINDVQNLVSLIGFVAVASIVSAFVSIAARRTGDAERARQEARVLAGLAGSGGPDPLQAIVEHLVRSFDLDAAAVLRVDGGRPGYVTEARFGDLPLARPDQATHVEPLDDNAVLAIAGRDLTTDDRRVVHAFTEQLSRARERTHLAQTAARAEALSQTDELRTALLRAVSHDLRTPLAGIKASVSSLRQPDVEWSAEQHAEFLEAIEDDTDRLSDIVTNLLDVGRLQAGVIRARMRAISLEEVIPAVLHSLGPRAADVELELPDDLPDIMADPALLERVMANLIANAVKWSPAHRRVLVCAHAAGGEVRIDVVDHGPGVKQADRAHVMKPFQRAGDTSSGGIGLGLAIADGFTKAMAARLTLGETPRGGLTATVCIPMADRSSQ